MQTITLTKPDDFHAHLRDGDFLPRTVGDLAASFRRAIIMPNLNPPVTTLADAVAYQKSIQAAVPPDLDFTPLMTLYLTDETTPTCIEQAKQHGIIGCKLYPAHATTHSEFGITAIEKLNAVFSAMESVDLPLLIHGEVTDSSVDIFDREALFIERYLIPLTQQFPHLRIVLEHITTEQAVAFVTASSDKIAATITAHHLYLNRNDLLVGGIHPHFYCLPVPKRERHQRAVVAAAISGNPKFFLGTDTAPHLQTKKESACGCAGIYTGFHALALYLEVFDKEGALAQFENFASVFGANFYQLPLNHEKITLIREKWQIPSQLAVKNGVIIPFKAGEWANWRVVTS